MNLRQSITNETWQLYRQQRRKDAPETPLHSFGKSMGATTTSLEKYALTLKCYINSRYDSEMALIEYWEHLQHANIIAAVMAKEANKPSTADCIALLKMADYCTRQIQERKKYLSENWSGGDPGF